MGHDDAMGPVALAGFLIAEIAIVVLASRQLGASAISDARRGPFTWLTVNALLAPGTVVHETAHAVAALLLGGRVEKFVPFRGLRHAPDGTDGYLLGYVIYALPRSTHPLRILVGLAPLWLTGLAVAAALSLASAATPEAWWGLLADQPWVAVPLVLVSLGMCPSPADLNGWPFGLVLAVLLLTGAWWLGVLGGVLAAMTAVLAVPAIVLGLLAALDRLA